MATCGRTAERHYLESQLKKPHRLGLFYALVFFIYEAYLLIYTIPRSSFWPSADYFYILPAPILLLFLNTITFPVVPIALEIPHISRYSRWGLYIPAVWLILLPLASLTFSLVAFQPKGKGEMLFTILGYSWPVYAAAMNITYGLFWAKGLREERLVSLNFRFCLYLLLAVETAIFGGWSYYFGSHKLRKEYRLPVVDPTFDPTFLLPLLTAVLYRLAEFKGHPFVFSRACGGTGLEPCDFPDVEAEGRGRIRLL